MLWLAFKLVEYGAEGTTWALYTTYRVARYAMYGPEQTSEEKQLTMVRQELSHLRDQQDALIHEIRALKPSGDGEHREDLSETIEQCNGSTQSPSQSISFSED
jgi:hypothetical protein